MIDILISKQIDRQKMFEKSKAVRSTYANWIFSLTRVGGFCKCSRDFNRWTTDDRIFQTSSQDRGFTLVELLLALAMMGLVMSLAGSGLYALMTANNRSQSETMDRLELERALAFITDEIKMSQQITNTITSIDDFNPASGVTNSSIQPILVLSPATNSRLTKPIVYYLADPPNSSVWLGPRAIYRWGPTLLQNGNYSDGNGKDIATIAPNAPVQYYNEVLVDRMSDVATTQATIPCETSYSYAVPAVTNRSGFYACIAPDRKSVKLWLHKHSNISSQTRSIHSLIGTRSN
jgi:prepilin-type N-terminal cleavage/methylation domain-containing protein